MHLQVSLRVSPQAPFQVPQPAQQSGSIPLVPQRVVALVESVVEVQGLVSGVKLEKS